QAGLRRWRRLEHLEQLLRRFGVIGECRCGKAERGHGNGGGKAGTTDEHPDPLEGVGPGGAHVAGIPTNLAPGHR
ncbi:hypothetical protein B8W90_13530, partial [Staphylococcus hominis]